MIQRNFRAAIGAVVTAVAAATAATGASAQDAYPVRPVTVIVPQAAGGANDAIARIVMQKLAEVMGQPFIVDNRPGAGGNVGTAQAAKAKPDGYTLLLTTNSAQVINPFIYKNTGFDPVKDFEPVGLVASAGYVLVANAAFPANSVADLIAIAKAKPGQINYASAGNGTLNTLSGRCSNVPQASTWFTFRTKARVLQRPIWRAARSRCLYRACRLHCHFCSRGRSRCWVS